MAGINAYDYANTGLNVARLALGTTVDMKSKTKDLQRDYYKIDTEAKVKREELQNRKDIQQMINDNNLILKQMGIDNDQFLAHVNNLAAEDRVKLQNEAAKAVQILKNQNVLDAIEAQYRRNIDELNLSSDEAMKRAVLGGFFQVISQGKTPLGDLVKTGEMTLMVQLLKEMFPGIENWNDPNFIGLGGNTNERKVTESNERKDSYEKVLQQRQSTLDAEENIRKTFKGRSKGLGSSGKIK